MNNSKFKNSNLLFSLLQDILKRQEINKNKDNDEILDLLSATDFKNFLYQIFIHSNEELKKITGIHYPEILKIKKYDQELLFRLKNDIENKQKNIKNNELENFKEDFKNFLKNEKELLEKLFQDNNISEMEKESKNFIFGEIIGILSIYINSDYFKEDFKDEIKNNKQISFDKLIQKINESCYFFDSNNRINVFDKDKNGKWNFNHPSGNKIDMVMIRKNKEKNKFDLSYAMITTSNDSEIETNSFFKHPIIISYLNDFINNHDNYDKINTKEKFDKEVGKILNSLSDLKKEDIENFYQNFMAKKENIDSFYENINGFFIYGSNLILKDKNNHILTNHITTSLFLAAQMLYSPENITNKEELIPNISYFFNKMKATFFNTSKMQQKNTFFEDNIQISKEFLEIVKYIEKQKEEKKSEKKIRKNLEENITEQFPLINKFINQYYNRKQFEKPGTVLNTINTFFNNNQRIKLLFNTMSVSKLFSFNDMEFIHDYTRKIKKDFYTPLLFSKEKDKIQFETNFKEERKAKEEERKAKEEFEKNLKEEIKKRKKREIIDIINILENKDINRIKKNLLKLEEEKQINFNDYKSDIRLIKLLILNNYIYNLELCDIKNLNEEEKHYMERLLLLTLTKENVKENKEKLSNISEIEVQKLENKFNKLKTIYQKKFKNSTSFSEDLKLKIENYLFQMLKTNRYNQINEKTFEEFLTKIEKNEIDLFNEKDINKKFNHEVHLNM